MFSETSFASLSGKNLDAIFFKAAKFFSSSAFLITALTGDVTPKVNTSAAEKYPKK